MCLEKYCGKCCEMHKSPINCLLHVIAAIVLICALWNRSIELILISFLIAVIGHIIQAVKEKNPRVESKKKMKTRKKAALEISIGTIVIIVIAVTMLILGIVFVRSVMCSALGLTGDLDDKVRGEINALFGSTGAEVQCIGASGEAVKIIPGETNNIWCGIKAKETAKYSITLVDYSGVISTKSELKKWIVTDSWEGTVAPGDDQPKKAIRLNIPDNAPEETIMLQVIIKKEGSIISTQDLDFKVSRAGFFRATMC